MNLLFPALLAAVMITTARINAAASDVTNAGPVAMAVVPAANPVMARGKGFEIRRSDMDKVLGSARANSSTPPEAQSPGAEDQMDFQVLSQLIEIHLVLQKATKAEKLAGKREADLTFTNILNNFGPADLGQRLKVAGMTENDLRAMLADEATAKASMTRQLGIKVTDAQVRQHYDTYPQISEQPEKVRVRQIALSLFDLSGAQLPADKLQARHQLIDDLHRRALAGEDFATLARQYSEDANSKDQGGELPPFSAEQMDFGNLAFSLKTNEISDVFTNTDGYCFIRLIARIPASKIAFADLADKIKNALIVDQKRKLAPAYMAGLKKEFAVEIVDARLKALAAKTAADAKAEAQREAEAIAKANSPEQKAAEAKVFGIATNPPPAMP